MIDLSRDEQLFEVRDGHENDLRDFRPRILHRALGLDAGCVEGVQTVAEQRGVRRDDSERQRGARAIAGLLEAFAQGGRRGVLAGIDEAARNLERDAAVAVTVLAHEHDFAVARDRHDLRPIDGLDAIERARLAIDGRHRERTGDVEDAALGDLRARKLLPSLQRRRWQLPHGVPS